LERFGFRELQPGHDHRAEVVAQALELGQRDLRAEAVRTVRPQRRRDELTKRGLVAGRLRPRTGTTSYLRAAAGRAPATLSALAAFARLQQVL
jgi:hypothetical protein